jgi:hypothetical protein
MSKKIESITYYNNFNMGDLHAVRSLINYVIKSFPELKHKLRHQHSEKILRDLNTPLYWAPYKEKFDFRGYYVEYGILNFNVQILCYDRFYFQRSSSTITTLYDIFARTLKDVFKHTISGNPIDFLPQINYKWYDITNIDKMTIPEKSVLFCNNEFQSEQGVRFDMDALLQQLANAFPDVSFYVTNKSHIEASNITYVNDITGDIGNDLNEISYLSTKCDVIIGRNSGPNTFCFVKENLLNPNKIFITFAPPSPLYGMIPEKWCDFGVSAITTPGNRAQFYNIPENDDAIRFSKIFNIFQKII